MAEYLHFGSSTRRDQANPCFQSRLRAGEAATALTSYADRELRGPSGVSTENLPVLGWRCEKLASVCDLR